MFYITSGHSNGCPSWVIKIGRIKMKNEKQKSQKKEEEKVAEEMFKRGRLYIGG